MGFKLPGKSITSGTNAHRSALKSMTVTDASGNPISINATGTRKTVDGVTTDVDATADKDLLSKRWAQGDEASGGTLNELVAARKALKAEHGGKRSGYRNDPKYAAIQNKINEALGSKKVHTATKTNRKGEEVEVKQRGTTTRKSDGATVERGLGAQKGKTLTDTDKIAEQQRISDAREDIQEAKGSGDKEAKLEGQKEISEIKSGRDNEYTGTKLSRWWHKGRAKRKQRKLDRLKN
jgi:hypothetical protein